MLLWYNCAQNVNVTVELFTGKVAHKYRQRMHCRHMRQWKLNIKTKETHTERLTAQFWQFVAFDTKLWHAFYELCQQIQQQQTIKESEEHQRFHSHDRYHNA